MKTYTRTKSRRTTVDCLACGEDVYVGQNPIIGRIIICHGCNSRFEIIDVEPVMVDWPGSEDDDVGRKTSVKPPGFCTGVAISCVC